MFSHKIDTDMGSSLYFVFSLAQEYFTCVTTLPVKGYKI